MSEISDLINKYGFPIVAAGGMGYFVFYVWQWATTEVKPVLGDANAVLIALIDRIRMLDNDLIRLNQKVSVVLHLRGKTIEKERVLAEHKINQMHPDAGKEHQDMQEEQKRTSGRPK
jgi:cytochrome c-type biogenesis protein CcmE